LHFLNANAYITRVLQGEILGRISLWSMGRETWIIDYENVFKCINLHSDDETPNLA
jgi:hypothetical protein